MKTPIEPDYDQPDLDGRQLFHFVIGALLVSGCTITLITLIPTRFVIILFALVIGVLIVGGIMFDVFSLFGKNGRRHGSKTKRPR